MKLNARKFASWLIALLLVTLVYHLAAAGEAMIASGLGLGVLFIFTLFRRQIFGMFHRHVEGAIDNHAAKLFGKDAEERPAFDADAAFANYMANREEPVPVAQEVPTRSAPTRGFGKKGL